MTTSPSEEMLVGFIALLAAMLVARRLLKALRSGEAMFARRKLSREEEPGRFRILLLADAIAFVLMCVISADLIFGLNLAGSA